MCYQGFKGGMRTSQPVRTAVLCLLLLLRSFCQDLQNKPDDVIRIISAWASDQSLLAEKQKGGDRYRMGMES